MSEAHAISITLLMRGWTLEPKKSGELVFTNTVKKKIWEGGESEDIIVIDLSRIDHYKKGENHLFADLSRDRVYVRMGYFTPQKPDENGRIYNYVATSHNLQTFYANIDTIAGAEEKWRHKEPVRHTPEKWGLLIRQMCG